jgi:hypothetical protein
MPARKPWCPVIKGWTKLGEALDRIGATPGSRVEQEICEHLRSGRLPAKYWRQNAPRAAVAANRSPISLVLSQGRQWENANPDYWTLKNLRKVRSVDGVEQCGMRNWYHVKTSRFKELYPAATTNKKTPPATPPAPERRRRRSIQYQIIDAILEAAFPGEGPKYTDRDMRFELEVEVVRCWEAECLKQNAKHLIPKRPKRDAIGRATGRHKPH